MGKVLTDSKLLLLGLIAEKPRYAYEIEKTIEDRGMREWSNIGFSSIYFVLGELEKKKLIKSKKPTSKKGKKVFSLTALGYKTLKSETLTTLATVKESSSSVLIAMVNWSCLEREEALSALNERIVSIEKELNRLDETLYENQPFPDFIELLFNLKIRQLKTELEWSNETLEYMRTKPWE